MYSEAIIMFKKVGIFVICAILGLPFSKCSAIGFMTQPTTLSSQSANTALANTTSSSAVPTAVSLPSCVDTGGNHLNYTSGTGFSCGTSTGGGSTEGTYTPTYTDIVNTTSGTPSTTYYIRVGNTVTVWGNIVVSQNSLVNDSFRLTIPVASTFTSTEQLSGTGTALTTPAYSVQIFPSVSTGNAQFSSIPAATGSITIQYSYVYKVL